MYSALKLSSELAISEGVEGSAEVEAEAVGGVVAAGPAGGGEELFGAGLEFAEVGKVLASLIGGGVELEEDLVVAADEADGERGAAADHEVLGGMSARANDLLEKGEGLVEQAFADFIHLNN